MTATRSFDGGIPTIQLGGYEILHMMQASAAGYLKSSEPKDDFVKYQVDEIEKLRSRLLANPKDVS